MTNQTNKELELNEEMETQQSEETINYEEIKLPMKYMGAKHGVFGYALNFLVGSAGTIDNYVDLFGGSGYAFVAVKQTGTTDYYINDIDFLLANFYNVLRDNSLYQKFRKDILDTIDSLNTKKELSKWLYGFCENTTKNWKDTYPLDNVDTDSKQSPNWAEYKKELNENKSDAAVAFTYKQCFPVTGGKTAKGAITAQSLNRFLNLDINGFDVFHTQMNKLKNIFNSDVLSDKSLIELFSENNVPGKKLPINFSDANSDMTIKGGTQPCTLFYSDSPYLYTSSYDGGGITKEQMEVLIDKLVTASQKKSHFIYSCRASKTIEPYKLERLNLVFDISKLERENGNIVLNTEKPVYDPTYEYQDCCLTEEVSAAEYFCLLRSLMKQNQSIYKNIFKKFESYSKNFYVLVCLEPNKDNREKDSKELCDIALKDLKRIEVFITDYEFECPPDKTFNNKLYRFMKCTISEFCDILDNSMLKTNRKYDIDVDFNHPGGYKIFRT